MIVWIEESSSVWYEVADCRDLTGIGFLLVLLNPI